VLWSALAAVNASVQNTVTIAAIWRAQIFTGVIFGLIDTVCACTRNLGEMLNVIRAFVYIVAASSLLAGCINDALSQANKQQLERQQAQLNQLKQEVADLQAQPPAYNHPSSPPGSCDSNIMREATRKGGERFAASDFSGALSYYQDALTACPDNAQANLNLARAYEAVGDRSQAVAHYRSAARARGSGVDANAVHDARAALTRLGG
jgi:tetratricopeptide (TPR) repeat protein